jgi:hypothetical protein
MSEVTSRYQEFEVGADELVQRVREIVREGNVSRLHIKKEDGETIMEVPLTAGVAVASAGVLMAPVLVAVAAVAALVGRLRVGVDRPEGSEESDEVT